MCFVLFFPEVLKSTYFDNFHFSFSTQTLLFIQHLNKANDLGLPIYIAVISV